MITVPGDVIRMRKIERHLAYGSSGPIGNPLSLIRLPREIEFRREWKYFTNSTAQGEILAHTSFEFPDIPLVVMGTSVCGWRCQQCRRFFIAASIDLLHHECMEAQ